MAQVVKTINLNATFSSLAAGESVEIPLGEVTAENIRNAASRFSRAAKKVRLKVSAPVGAATATVICEPKKMQI